MPAPASSLPARRPRAVPSRAAPGGQGRAPSPAPVPGRREHPGPVHQRGAQTRADPLRRPPAAVPARLVFLILARITQTVRRVVKSPVPSEQAGRDTDARDSPGRWMPAPLPSACPQFIHARRNGVGPQQTAARVGSACTPSPPSGPLHCHQRRPCMNRGLGKHLRAGSQKLAAFPHLPPPGISEVPLGTHVLLPGS